MTAVTVAAAAEGGCGVLVRAAASNSVRVACRWTSDMRWRSMTCQDLARGCDDCVCCVGVTCVTCVFQKTHKKSSETRKSMIKP
eukprot:scaffold123689_cov60-Phaeocystis_antarctica.AAC.1